MAVATLTERVQTLPQAGSLTFWSPDFPNIASRDRTPTAVAHSEGVTANMVGARTRAPTV